MVGSNDSLEWKRVSDLLGLLADAQYHSGEELGEQLNISRAAVWKYIKRIEDLGLALESIKGKGYRLQNSVELLDKNKIKEILSNEILNALAEIHLFPEIDSTNGFLLNQSNISSQVCIAERQLAGRGRRGRSWVSPFAQNIYFSLGWHFASGVTALKGLSLLVGCVIVRVLKKLGFREVGLKWPNDVLVNTKKLAGVLVEIRGDLAGDCELVIGIGLNYRMQNLIADSITQPWIDLQQLADMESVNLPSRNQLVAALISELLTVLQDYELRTFSAYKAEWETYNLHQGKKIELLMANSNLSGMCLGVDDDGAVIIEDVNNQLHFLHGGEISLRSVE